MSGKHARTSNATKWRSIGARQVSRMATAYLVGVLTGLGRAHGEGLGEALVRGLLG